MGLRARDARLFAFRHYSPLWHHMSWPHTVVAQHPANSTSLPELPRSQTPTVAELGPTTGKPTQKIHMCHFVRARHGFIQQSFPASGPRALLWLSDQNVPASASCIWRACAVVEVAVAVAVAVASAYLIFQHKPRLARCSTPGLDPPPGCHYYSGTSVVVNGSLYTRWRNFPGARQCVTFHAHRSLRQRVLHAL
ncbi:LADA_0H04588g1_1 [Lachancea dasiensis]|uniref:LADA_0H04588g1_1 n=1 Tax=Lachancea dasiensis TaxID=1072105 RepID=A0A1G4K0Y5_9SACH|nr:LADA_0H04588g1_1 [Lachancea dasiensis]